MGEYDDWVKRQAAEKAVQEKASRERDEIRRANELREKNTRSASLREEALRELKGPADKVEGVLREALRAEFGRAKQSRITQDLRSDGYVFNSTIDVKAHWGDQLEMSAKDKEWISGKSSFFKGKPLEVLDYRYYSLDFSVGYREITLLRGDSGFNYPKISRENFDRDYKSIYPLVQRGLADKKELSESWYLRGNKYVTGHDLSEQARFDAMDA